MEADNIRFSRSTDHVYHIDRVLPTGDVVAVIIHSPDKEDVGRVVIGPSRWFETQTVDRGSPFPWIWLIKPNYSGSNA